MSKKDSRVTAYINESEPFARPILKHLRRVIQSAAPRAEETIKSGMPTYVSSGKILCGVAGCNAPCALWFWKGSATMKLKMEGTGMGNFGKIKSLKDLPSVSVIKKYIKLDMKKNELAA